MSAGRAYRLWRLAKLQVPRKRGRKRVASSRPRPQAPTATNQVWSYDFVFDRCANGQQLKCLTVTDEFTKEGLAIEVDGRHALAAGDRGAVAAGQRAWRAGVPAFRQWAGVRLAGKLLSWIVAQQIDIALIDPGKPWQNGVARASTASSATNA